MESCRVELLSAFSQYSKIFSDQKQDCDDQHDKRISSICGKILILYKQTRLATCVLCLPPHQHDVDIHILWLVSTSSRRQGMILCTWCSIDAWYCFIFNIFLRTVGSSSIIKERRKLSDFISSFSDLKKIISEVSWWTCSKKTWFYFLSSFIHQLMKSTWLVVYDLGIILSLWVWWWAWWWVVRLGPVAPVAPVRSVSTVAWSPLTPVVYRTLTTQHHINNNINNNNIRLTCNRRHRGHDNKNLQMSSFWLSRSYHVLNERRRTLVHCWEWSWWETWECCTRCWWSLYYQHLWLTLSTVSGRIHVFQGEVEI